MGSSTNAKLNDQHRAFLVREMACYASPLEAATALKVKFGIEVTPQAAQHYDATKNGGSKPSKKWAELFALLREAFLEDVTASVPFANRSVRVRKLAQAAATFEKQKNLLAMARILEMIAKEVGGAFTNKRELTGKDGGPIRYADVSDMTDEQIHAELREYGIDPAQVHAAPKTTQ